MAEKRLFNILKLAYAPLSNFDFVMVKDDPLIKEFINSGKIYMIVQRAVLSFENLTIDLADQMAPILTFEIHKKGLSDFLKCQMPLYQEKLLLHNDSVLHLAVNYHYPKPIESPGEMPFNGLANFVIESERNNYYWFSPEKLIYHYCRNTIDANIDGKLSSFLNYQVHYIGKATEQDVIRRLTGHSHLQDILSIESPFHYGSLPTDEIAILFFDFRDNIFTNTFDADDDIKEAVNLIMGEMPFDQDTIYLGAEKAFIKALTPKHNRQLYLNYPKSRDGLYKHALKTYTYSLYDPLTLNYSDGAIRGPIEGHSSDMIVVSDDCLKVVNGAKLERMKKE